LSEFGGIELIFVSGSVGREVLVGIEISGTSSTIVPLSCPNVLPIEGNNAIATIIEIDIAVILKFSEVGNLVKFYFTNSNIFSYKFIVYSVKFIFYTMSF
jgi:hypothetical protein